MKNIHALSDDEAVKAIYDWIDEEQKEDFDTEFVDSVAEFLENRGELTPGQRNAINNIIEKFHISF